MIATCIIASPPYAMFPFAKIAASAKSTQFLRPGSEELSQCPDSVTYVGPKTKAILISFNASISLLWGKTASYIGGVHALPNNYYSLLPQSAACHSVQMKTGFVIRNVEPGQEALTSVLTICKACPSDYRGIT
jgi:hypothetical protein